MTDCKKYSPDYEAQGDCRLCGHPYSSHYNTGLFSRLTNKQKQAALDFQEDESFGPDEFKMRNKMELTVTEISVHSKTENPIFGETVTRVKLDDEGGGMFVKLIQHTDEGVQEIRLDFTDIPAIMKAIEMLKTGDKEDG